MRLKLRRRNMSASGTTPSNTGGGHDMDDLALVDHQALLMVLEQREQRVRLPPPIITSSNPPRLPPSPLPI
jgi:hypothetical protein